MEIQLLLKIIHMTSISVLLVILLARGLTLFKGVQGNQPNPAGRTLWVALQHLSVTLIVVTGIVLLALKDFQVETWFYAKIILFLVMLSSLMKAYRKTDSILLVQRRAGWGIALVALLAIIALVMIKPSFG
ncbi:MULTISPECIES: SirB2 family protein [Acinetobacter]|uniref:SirB2 family protein n=1 Tax=Acinetobacter indicus TaxID=756892 RepID=A0A7S6VPV9_9GAMM|nr:MULTISPECIES: SirB2 family protein [Acinetobacter]QIC77363.1 SirB2 family protein [Acinetobacter indicus]QOW42690.1 SirB2 family protein [Acinetobacter indicus]